MERPRFIDLGPTDSRATSRATSRTTSRAASRAGLPSPRIQHYDGDIPPALSPLDAFAAHSRRLAKELEETRLAGQRRMSRLPPQVVTQSLSQHQANRPAVFRSLSGGGDQEGSPITPLADQDSAENSPAVTNPLFRPASTYPRISAVLKPHGEDYDDDGEEEVPDCRLENIDEFTTVGLHQVSHPSDYFGAPTTNSPQALQNEHSFNERKSLDQRSFNVSQSELVHGLLPPNAPFSRKGLYQESSDDDYTSSNAGSFFSATRKLSSSSGVSLPRSPASPAAHQRHPSNNSTSSLPGSRNLPSHLNFSRPRSSASLHTKSDSPTKPQQYRVHQRKTSATSDYARGQTSFDDTRSVMSDGLVSGAASSYTHTRFDLPRGRVDRTSGVFTGLSTPHFEWQEPMFPSTPPMTGHSGAQLREPSPHRLGRPSQDISPARTKTSGFSFDFDTERPVVREVESRPSSSHTQNGSIKSTTSGITPATYYGSQKIPNLPPIPGSIIDEQSRSSRSNSTVRPTTARSVSNYQSFSSDDHVTKAIELHQHGDLKESTYHLRIAAKQNHPTGMLLYALACRHGWGMRPNQKEGVGWLKRAVDTAMLEVADDEESETNGKDTKPKADFNEKKAHRAQFALSIYELGISHLNGWGVEQDKALALRCFEIAGNWGDPDALTEAGFCYAEGIGCKKDLKKAAKFYRMAEKKGVSMVGNSWIYKDKYNDDSEKENSSARGRGRGLSASDSKNKGRKQSKSRGLFGGKKKAATGGNNSNINAQAVPA